jgi:serine/threonine protein phosphatase PrpC
MAVSDESAGTVPAVLVAAAASRAGPGRDHNEDNHRVDAQAGVFLVADGMGGHAAGEVASAIAVAHVHEAWTVPETRQRADAYAARPEAVERKALFHAVRAGVMGAHLRIAEEAQRDNARRGMGTTMTGLLVAGGDAFFAHAGDSRAYLVQGDRVALLSEDHDLDARLKAAGMGARGRSVRGFLTSALGIGDITRIATFALPMVAGDRLVLCTDGVHEHLTSEAELARVVCAGRDPAGAAALLVELPRTRGGRDDATALVVDVVEAASGPAWPPITTAARAREADAVARSALFEALSSQERLRALRIATPCRLADGQALAPVHAEHQVAYVVIEGQVAMPAGERLGAGGLIYAGALIEGTGPPREAAVACSAGRALMFRRTDFFELSEEDPDLGVKLYAALARLMVR